MNTQLSNLAASQAADAVCGLLTNGYLRLYTGPQPATGSTAITTQVKLAELRWGAPAFAPAVNGVAVASAITPDTHAAATGTATWFRAFKSDGTTAVFDGSVGTSGCNLNLNAVLIAAGAAVSLDNGYTYTQAKTQ